MEKFNCNYFKHFPSRVSFKRQSADSLRRVKNRQEYCQLLTPFYATTDLVMGTIKVKILHDVSERQRRT